jgi:hypothetical protein
MSNDERRIGRGLLTPLVREHGDFANGTGPTLLACCLKQVLMTTSAGFEGRVGGTYPWRLNFGSFLRLLRHSNFFTPDAKAGLGAVYVSDAVERWEPRVDVSTEHITPLQDSAIPNALNLRVYFEVSQELGGDVRNTDADQNWVEVTS